MDRGIPTEEVLEQMRQSDPPVQYLVGTPKGRLTQYEQALLQKSWQEVRPGVRVKLLPQDQELYVLAESQDRVAKERSMRRRQLKWLWRRLKEVQGMKCQRDELLKKLGRLSTKRPAPGGWSTWRWTPRRRLSPTVWIRTSSGSCANARAAICSGAI